MKNITETETWKKLEVHFNEMSRNSMRELFDKDADRFNKYTIAFNEILLDYSKNIISDETMSLLLKLCVEADVKQRIDDMFGGRKINNTENRAVLHTALRNRSNEPVYVDSMDIMSHINSVLNHMREFCNDIHNGNRLGYSGKKITDIVNIGIGGSDLGPAMVCRALKPYAISGMNVHFVSNVDSTHLSEILTTLNSETTLFIIASKTFTTQETITNAVSARAWFLSQCGNNTDFIGKHFVALSTNIKAVTEFGINPGNMFEFWDWVGGRYSLWSAIGLSIALYIGFDNFAELLNGAYEMDVHFRTAPYARNIPVILAMLGIWYGNFFDARTQAIIPYDQHLEYFTDFLQQLDMESNGKSTNRDGIDLNYATGPVIWGKPGTNAQHSFFQLLHQGTQMIPADFLASINCHNDIGSHHNILIANFLAQTEALMNGKNADEVIAELKAEGKTDEEIKKILPFKIFKGNKPTNTIFYKLLTPGNLGSIIAMYEHKVFVQGIVWNINSFDQWGVELGKQLAKKILPELGAVTAIDNHDSSTNGLINYYNSMK